jgi:hypothetical protein
MAAHWRPDAAALVNLREICVSTQKICLLRSDAQVSATERKLLFFKEVSILENLV